MDIVEQSREGVSKTASMQHHSDYTSSLLLTSHSTSTGEIQYNYYIPCRLTLLSYSIIGYK